MLTVEIVNFKTIEKLRFEFEGFASIIGRNRVGKSAILGAIRACLTNTIDKGAIRQGCDFTEVRLIHDHSGLDCFWHYEEGDTYYLINGQNYTKLGGAIPPPLLALGFGPLEAGEEKVHLWDVKQFKSLFLVDEGRSNFTTDLLAKIFKIDEVYKAKDLVAKDAKEARAKHKVRKADLATSENSVAALAKFTPVEKAVSNLSSQLDVLESSEATLAKARTLLSILSGTKAKAITLNRTRTVANPDASDVTASLRMLSDLSRLVLRQRSASRGVQELAKVSQVPPVAGQEDLSALSSRVTVASGMLQRLKGSKASLQALQAVGSVAPPDQGGLDASKEKLVRMRLLADTLASSRKNASRLAGVAEVTVVGEAPEASKLSELKQLLARLKAAAREHRMLQAVSTIKVSAVPDSTKMEALRGVSARLMEARDKTATLEASLKDARKAVFGSAEALGAFSSCPLCGSTLEEGSHAH